MNSLGLGKVFGIEIRLHYTWFFIFILLALSLATDFFPSEYPGYSVAAYWALGIAAAVLLFASVLAHELSHSLVAKRQEMKVKGITLFFFGGIASASGEGLTPKREFLIAGAGPAFSLALGGFFFLATLITEARYIFPVTDYLFKLNVILAIFNLIPGFPLDGGRIFRAAVWELTGSLLKATKIASGLGRIFGVGMAGYGIYLIFSSGAGLWYVLLGGFLYVLAGMSYRHTLVQDVLSSREVKEFMSSGFRKLSADQTVEEFADEFKGGLFIVREKGKLHLIDFEKMQKIPRHQWPLMTIGDVMVEVTPLNENESAYDALLKMDGQSANMLPVVKNKKVTGVVTLENLLRFDLASS